MTDKQKIQILRTCFEDTIWMAARYAHGRNTYAPGMVRNAVHMYKGLFPDWKPKTDRALQPPEESELNGFKLKSDYLNDIFGDD